MDEGLSNLKNIVHDLKNVTKEITTAAISKVVHDLRNAPEMKGNGTFIVLAKLEHVSKNVSEEFSNLRSDVMMSIDDLKIIGYDNQNH